MAGALGLLLALPATGPSVAVATDQGEPVRVLIVGDSATHGSSGDWTWRHRLWQHFEETGVEVDFVGPYDDVKALERDGFAHDYLDPDFDRDHASRWGHAFDVDGLDIAGLIADHHPDVVVEMLGVNNLTWGGLPPAEVDELLRKFVDQARAADPEIDLVLSTVPQTWFPTVPGFNELLLESASQLDDAASQISVARSDLGYVERTHTWDPGHPNARGELRLAAAVQDALVDLGIGMPFDRPLPKVPVGPRRAPRLSGSATDGTVSLSWSGARVATSQIIERRDLAAGTGWQRWDEVGDNPWLPNPESWSSPAPEVHRLQFRLRPVKGYQRAAPDVRSNVVTLVARPAAPPAGQVTGSRFGRALVRWQAAPRATRHQVRIRLRQPNARWRVLRRTTSTRTTIVGLRGRQVYDVAVRGWRDGVSSLWRSLGAVRVPPPRMVLGVRAVSPRRNRVRITATRRPEAARYLFRAAAASNCRARPPAGSFRRVGLRARPRLVTRSPARALWVRAYAVRNGVRGPAGAPSTACVRVR